MCAVSETLTDEQLHTLHEAAAYRYPRFTIGLSPDFSLEVSAKSANGSRTIWDPRVLATGTFAEMKTLHVKAMAEYKLLAERGY